MTLEETILNDLGKEMADAIDWEINRGMLLEMGWTLVQLSRYVDNYHAIDIREWVALNCRETTVDNGATWIFKDPADATMFTLRWVK